MTDYEYIARRLQQMAAAALLEAQKATVRIEGEATLAGALGGSRMHLQVHETMGDVLKEAMARMAAFTYSYSGETSDQAANALEGGGFKFVDHAVQWLHRKYEASKAFGGYLGPPLSQLEKTLRDVVRHAVEDFHHGMVGEARLKKDPLVNVVANITNSPNAVAQTVVGDHNQQSVQQQASAIRQVIDDLLASDEFKTLDEPKREAVQDTADVVRDEIAKSSPDKSKVGRWVNRLLELTKEFGMHVAAAALAKVVFG